MERSLVGSRAFRDSQANLAYFIRPFFLPIAAGALPVVLRLLSALSEERAPAAAARSPDEAELFASALALIANLATAGDATRQALIRNGAGAVLVAIAQTQVGECFALIPGWKSSHGRPLELCE